MGFRLSAAAVALVLAGLTAWGTGAGGVFAASRAEVPERARAHVRENAVRLMIRDWTAVALPRAWDMRVLRERMRRYMAAGSLERALRQAERTVAKLGRRGFWNAWMDSVTVGEWTRVAIRGRTATVVFVSAAMLSRHGRRSDSSLRRWTVDMVWEDGRWRLRRLDSDWVTPEGPMGTPGSRALADYPEHVVFRNPRPRLRAPVSRR